MGWVGAKRYSGAIAVVADVSIPERVWGGLEPTALRGVIATLVVSIPERVWGGLEL